MNNYLSLKHYIIFYTAFILSSCSNSVEIENQRENKLKAALSLELVGEKKFILDSTSAPKPQYTQIYMGQDSVRYFTFLNVYNNSIYFYNYEDSEYSKIITFEREGPHGIPAPKGYFIKTLDSIFIYNKQKIEIIQANVEGKVKKKFSLRGDKNDSNWGLIFPQYNPQTVAPFICSDNELLLSGFFFGPIPESVIESFKFTSRLDLTTGEVKFSHNYPVELYGSNYNWDGELFTLTFSELTPNKDSLVISFPVTHNLYIADLKSGEYKTVYAGSNYAGTISSIKRKIGKSSNEELMAHIISQDEYTAIKYDKFRNVYYRFLLKSASATVNQTWLKKHISVIIMDENFNYLGETDIGTGEDWYWQNSFVTEEGLNIEYLEKDFEEIYLTFKIFNLKKI